ncbi:MAG: nitrate/nitrite transporter [Chitinophagales bacterium]
MKKVLAIIVITQFFCTSVWFASNAIMPELIKSLNLKPQFLAHCTSSVQFGFISGTFLFALLTIADRFSPSVVYFISSLFSAFFNLMSGIDNINSSELLFFRFLTGFFLAGIYPVGMKIASDYYNTTLGRSLGFLVGALVVGTAFPHLLKTFTSSLPWKYVIYSTSALCVAGGLIMFLFVPDGPHRSAAQKIKLNRFLTGFRNKNFRSIASGYFGHMWELYTFWAFVPVILTNYNDQYPDNELNIPLLSFFIIGSGGIACICSGLLSQNFSSKKIATIALIMSCLCCVFSPFFLLINSTTVFLAFLFFWGLVVIADSPLFSTLIAQNAEEESRGTSLTIINCIGFSITILSIQFINVLSNNINPKFIYMFLAIGPVLGIIALLLPARPKKG